MENIAFYWGNIPEPLFGGIDRVTCVWAQAFKDKGYKVFLIYTGGEERTLPSMFVDKFKWEYPERDFENLQSFINHNHIDLCINQRAYDHNIIKQLRNATLVNGCKIYSVLHNKPGFEFYCKPGILGIKKRIWGILNRKKIYFHYKELVTFSDKVIVLSKSYIPLFLDQYKICESHKLVAISNPVPFDFETINWERKEKILLVVSRLSEHQKRISLVLKAWERIFVNGWSLVIVGDGPNRHEYEDYVKKRKMKDVVFIGNSDPEIFYRKSKIFLMTSIYEGFPLTLLEAMQFGVVPVVFDSCSVFSDIISSGENGFLVENNKLNEYIETVEYLMNSENLLNEMSDKALMTAKKFTADKLINEWLKE